MSSAIRVVVAASSKSDRDALRSALTQATSGLRCVGEGDTPPGVLKQCASVQPDVLVLLLGGSLEGSTLSIMETSPVPILVLWRREARAKAEVTLTLGAVETLEIPPGALEAGPACDSDFSTELIRLTRLVARIPVVTRRPARSSSGPQHASGSSSSQSLGSSLDVEGSTETSSGALRLVALGGSTGGTRALSHVLRDLPKDYPLPIVVVQHVASDFGASLARWLNGETRLAVRVATSGEGLEAGTVYLAPPDRHLLVCGERLTLGSGPERHHCRPSVDALFESILAAGLAPQTLACVLSGMGRDGASGLQALRQAGAQTIAQDEASSAVFGMPQAAIQLDAAQRVLDLDGIAHALASATSRPADRMIARRAREGPS